MATEPNTVVGLVGDIGGTNARFAIAHVSGDQVTLDHVMSLPGKDYGGVEAAAQDYMARVGHGPLDAAAAACAGPVVDGAVSFTNVDWSTTERGFGAAIGLNKVYLMNDLAAVAWAAPALEATGLRRIAHTGSLNTPAPALASAGRTTRAILSAGTGCNASAFVQNESGEAVVVGEFGHATFAPTNLLEIEIWRRLHAEYGRVSIERVLSGPGLFNLYRALCDIEGEPMRLDTPAAVATAGQSGDRLAFRCAEQFCGIMGAVAGDVALCFGARGGVYLAGGVAVSMLSEQFDTSFRSRFEDKGRFRTYLGDIPTLLIQNTNVAMIGAARAMAVLSKRNRSGEA